MDIALLTKLRQEVAMQNGTADCTDAEFNAFCDAFDRNHYKLHSEGRYDFGSRVVILFKNGTRDHGYLTCLPGDTDPELDAIVHIPHTQGEKCDAGPEWVSVASLLNNELIKTISIL